MVNVIGLGYIGLPTALMLASHGIEVVGTDCNTELVNTLSSGKTTFEEAGLDELFSSALSAGLSFSEKHVSTDTYIISVPTPYNEKTKKIDPSFVIEAAKAVLTVCKRGSIIIIESTVSPGTIDKYVRPLVEAGGYVAGVDIHLVHAPERIIPGNMIYELVHNNRTVGADNKEIGERVAKLYSSFCEGEIVVTDIRTAEMTKVVENTFRAVNIAFANELAKLSRAAGLDVYEIIRICNMHPRVNILNPGPGVGGHCIGVDPWFLVGDYPEYTNVITEAMRANAEMPEYVLSRIREVMSSAGITDISKVGLYGLTYKENVDDVRSSPTLQLIEKAKLAGFGENFAVYDPLVKRDIIKNQYHSPTEFISKCDMVVIMVGHSALSSIKELLLEKTVLDTRNVISGERVHRL